MVIKVVGKNYSFSFSNEVKPFKSVSDRVIEHIGQRLQKLADDDRIHFKLESDSPEFIRVMELLKNQDLNNLEKDKEI